MSNPEHLELLIEYRRGQPLRETVHVEEKGGGFYRLLYSPGFAQGIAAGDEFRLLGNDGAFEVTRRSGNLAVQVFTDVPVSTLEPELTRQVEQLGGRRDGGIERGAVFTIPLEVGFSAVEALFDQLVSEQSGAGFTWAYGNVYDAVDGTTPLGWWEGLDSEHGAA